MVTLQLWKKDGAFAEILNAHVFGIIFQELSNSHLKNSV